MKVLGIDPGIRGGLAIVMVTNDIAMLVAAIDIPTVGAGAKERVNVLAVQEFILSHGQSFAFIEHAQAMPKQGASSGFKYGRSVGQLEAVITLCGIPIEIISPGIWKRGLRLLGGEKELSRQRALEMFPSAHGFLSRRKDHGRAEAALIALYGMRQQGFHREMERVPETAPAEVVK
jgi:crossover junction endodeoxyribonuclease RuvC